MSKKRKLEITILDLQQVPMTFAYVISLQVKDLETEFTWRKAFRLQYDRPVSMEELKHELSQRDLSADEPTDPMKFVKEEIDKPFVITLDSTKKLHGTIGT